MRLGKAIWTAALAALLVGGSLWAHEPTHDEEVNELLDQLRVLHPGVVDPPPEPPPPDPPPPLPPPSSGVPAAIAAMLPGSWLHYGAPWKEAEPAEDPCVGTRFGSILAAWNGWARDGLRYVYVAASGGHGDGCDNGVYRYDIQTGRAENVVPHVALNNFSISGQPFVADGDGVQILPRSSHTGIGSYLDGDWLYLITGSVYGNGKKDGQVWRYHVTEQRWERLPDRRKEDGSVKGNLYALLLHTPDGDVFMGSWSICDVDLVAGRYDRPECRRDFSFDTSSSVAWDPARQGIWHVDKRDKDVGRKVRFLRRLDGIWQVDDSLSGAIPEDVRVGLTSLPGICVVPDQGILVWSKSALLYQWDGATWTTLTPPGGPPLYEKRRVASKWSWDPESQTCIGGSTVAEGLWIYKPTSAAQPEPPTPDPGPDPIPPPGPEPTEGLDIEAKWAIDPTSIASIGGVEVAVAPWTPAPVDQRIERLPGAPDYDALCPGPWEERHYRTNEDLAGTRYNTGGSKSLSNVRVYLHPLKNAAGDVVAYTSGMRIRSDCFEIIGVPDEGRKPQMISNIDLDIGGVGLIVRGLIMAQLPGSRECIVARAKSVTKTQPAFVVVHDSQFYACYSHVHFWGVSPGYTPIYIEMIGNVSAYAGSHVIYVEGSVGRFVYKSNVCFAPGWGHCIKVLSYSALIEGNVFSNAGLDGQTIVSPDGKTKSGGMHPLDMYGCTVTVVRGNTFVYKTTNNVRNIIAFRGRKIWGNCFKGRRLSEDSAEVLRVTEPAYFDPVFWADVAAARPLFDEGYEAAEASPMLFTHLVENNRFIVLLAWRPDSGGEIENVTQAQLSSLRPVDKKDIRLAAKAEAEDILAVCGNARDQAHLDCFLASASDVLLYAYNHVTPTSASNMWQTGKVPSALPIRAPGDWAERYAVWWGEQEGWACDAEGVACAPWDAPLPRVPVEDWGHDPVKQNSPPRVIVKEDS